MWHRARVPRRRPRARGARRRRPRRPRDGRDAPVVEDLCAQPVDVLDRPVHATGVRARDRRHGRRGAGGEHQVVVLELPAVGQADCPGGGIDAFHSDAAFADDVLVCPERAVAEGEVDGAASRVESATRSYGSQGSSPMTVIRSRSDPLVAASARAWRDSVRRWAAGPAPTTTTCGGWSRCRVSASDCGRRVRHLLYLLSRAGRPVNVPRRYGATVTGRFARV